MDERLHFLRRERARIHDRYVRQVERAADPAPSPATVAGAAADRTRLTTIDAEIEALRLLAIETSGRHRPADLEARAATRTSDGSH